MDNREELIKEILNLAKHITVEEARELIRAEKDAVSKAAEREQ